MASQTIELTRKTGSILPDGPAKFTIDRAELKEGAKGPYIALRLKMANGSLVFNNVSMSDASAFMRDAFLDSIGAAKKGKMTIAALKGKTGWCNLGNETFEGRLKNVVTQWITADVAIQMQSAKAKVSDPLVADGYLDVDVSEPEPDEEDGDESEDDESDDGPEDEDDFPF